MAKQIDHQTQIAFRLWKNDARRVSKNSVYKNRTIEDFCEQIDTHAYYKWMDQARGVVEYMIEQGMIEEGE